jgi:hypothetical protein
MSKTRSWLHWYVFLAQILIISVLALRSSHQATAADETVAEPPSRVVRQSYLRDPISVQLPGEPKWVRTSANQSLSKVDPLWTYEGDGRAELTTVSATIRRDASTDLAVIHVNDRIRQMRIIMWTVTIRVQQLGRDQVVEVDAPGQALPLLQASSHRVEASEGGEWGTLTLLTVRLVGVPAGAFPALPPFDGAPNGAVQPSGFIAPALSVQRGGDVASSVVHGFLGVQSALTVE